MPMKIVIADCSWNSIDIETEYLPNDAIIVGCQCKTEEDVLENCADADAILAEYAPLNKRVLSQLKHLKIISNTATGVDNIDVQAAKELGIAVANVPGYCISEVADQAMALILANCRYVVGYNNSVKEGNWDLDCMPKMRRIDGMTIGLVGFGKISRAVATRAQAFGMKVLTYSKVPDEIVSRYNVKKVDIDELLSKSDIISSHIPFNENTADFFNLEKFEKMAKKPIFVNTSRGKVVNEQDLVIALEKGYIRAAGLDVMREEPPAPDNRLLKMDNVIITPHAGFYSIEALEEVRRRSAMNVTNFFKKHYEDICFLNK